MKHLSLWLAVTLLGSMPLAAAAFDYGPGQPLLAASGGETRLPGAPAPAADAELPHGDVALAGNDDAGATAGDVAVPRVRAPATADNSVPPRHAAATSSKPRVPPSSARPLPEPQQAPWQSLLPGSIQ